MQRRVCNSRRTARGFLGGHASRPRLVAAASPVNTGMTACHHHGMRGTICYGNLFRKHRFSPGGPWPLQNATTTQKPTPATITPQRSRGTLANRHHRPSENPSRSSGVFIAPTRHGRRCSRSQPSCWPSSWRPSSEITGAEQPSAWVTHAPNDRHSRSRWNLWASLPRRASPSRRGQTE